jgi:hypothetical protein
MRSSARVAASALIGTLFLAGCLPQGAAPTVVVYGATPAGVMAAIAAAEEGASVRLLEPSGHVGGMLTGGLGATDTERPGLLGGLSRQFFVRIGRAYGAEDGSLGLRHEPHVGREVIDAMLAEAGVEVETHRALASVDRDGDRLVAVVLTDDSRVHGDVFIDATYEGDLMAAAGVAYRIGREAADEYGEPLGVGEADEKVQAYTYRLCVTELEDNRAPIGRPDDYTRADFTPVLDHLGEDLESVISRVAIPGDKWDLNNRDPFSTDAVGQGWWWAEADAAEREVIATEHRRWVQGFLYFLATDGDVPPSIRDEAGRLGLCTDEWPDSGHWPPQLYVREARRMVGAYVLRQSDLETDTAKADSIAVGTYRVDSHAVDRVDGVLLGVLNLRIGPYAIPYRSITPRPDDAENLLVPVALSATHVAFSSLRMEPTWMTTGEAAGVAAAMTVTTVQDVDVDGLVRRLEERGGVVDPAHTPRPSPSADRPWGARDGGGRQAL